MKTLSTAAILGLICAAGAQNIDSAALVATVNGDKILNGEYYTRMAFLDDVGTLNNNRFVEAPPAFLTLERLINERLIMQLAKEKGVAPTQAEIQAEMTARKTDNPETLQRLRDFGVSDATILSQIALDLAQFNLVTMGVTITDAQIDNHYKLNKGVYVTPAMVKLRVIVVDKAEDEAKVDTALKTKSFGDVAKELSTDITKYAGGDLPEVAISASPKSIQDQVNKLNSGDKTPWIESEGSFMKYLIEKKTESKQLPLDDNLRKEIRRRMMLIAGQQKNDVQKMISDKRKSAKVTISAPGLQKLWDLYIKGQLGGKS